MARYIPKDALVKEIKRLEKINQEYKKTWKWRFKWFYRTIIGRLEVLEGLKNYIDTLEVKEVNLEKEIASQYESNHEDYLTYEEFADIAKHFFELGMQQSKKHNNNEE